VALACSSFVFFWLSKKQMCCKVRWAKTMTKKVGALLPSVIAFVALAGWAIAYQP
jgi:hypothetical protein